MTWGWQLRGVCAGRDPAMFFAPDGARGPERTLYEVEAKALCAECPVRQRCLDYALETRMAGVWGGTNEVERRALRREQTAS